VDLSRRLRQYFNGNSLKRNNSMLICRALLKHGHSNFSLEIIEYCPASKLLKREKHYFQILKPDYNILPEPGSPVSGRNHSVETRAKIAAKIAGLVRSVVTRAKMSASKLGKTRSEVTRAKISASKMGNTLPPARKKST
jgi:group I intron endonuclease